MDVRVTHTSHLSSDPRKKGKKIVLNNILKRDSQCLKFSFLLILGNRYNLGALVFKQVKFFAFTEKSLIFQFENETFFSNFQTMCKSRGSSKTVQIVLAKKILKIPQTQVSKKTTTLDPRIASLSFQLFCNSSWFQYKSSHAFWGLILVSFWKSLECYVRDQLVFTVCFASACLWRHD